jgi:hypothetical protein
MTWDILLERGSSVGFWEVGKVRGRVIDQYRGVLYRDRKIQYQLISKSVLMVFLHVGACLR